MVASWSLTQDIAVSNNLFLQKEMLNSFKENSFVVGCDVAAVRWRHPWREGGNGEGLVPAGEVPVPGGLHGSRGPGSPNSQ